jgi:Kdo2-lipid IVA lauroyltransferase/acyltransferase
VTIRIAIFFMWLLHFLPFRVLVALGNGLGWVGYKLARERRRVADINLRLCFPQMSAEARADLVRRHFMMFGRGLVERVILWWSSADRINRLIRVRGEEHLNAVRGRPSILLMPHFVGMDVGGQWIAQRIDSVSMYSLQKNAYINKLLLAKRGRFGHQALYSRQEGLRPVIKAMRENRPLYYLPDQDQGVRDGAFIPFFGVPAATMTSVPRLARMTGATVVPAITRLLPGGEGYELTFYPPWDDFPSGDEIADARRMNAFIEERVLEMPEQYFWVHKRFKTRPEGEPKFY